MAKGYLISFMLIVGWIFVQILFFHGTGTRQKFKVLTLLFLLTLPLYVLWYCVSSPTLGCLPPALTQTPLVLGLVNGLGIHCLFYVVYVACFYCLDRPVTLRILIEFLKAPSGALTLSEMKAVYGLKEMLRRRLEGLKDGDLAVEREGKFVLTRKGVWLGRVFHWGRRLLKLDRLLKGY